MKLKFTALVAAVAMLGVSMPAAAAVNARQLNQQRNIDAGVRSGKLTYREARTLRMDVKAIERNKRAYTRDGRYSNREKARIHAQQEALSNKIDRLKANGRRGN